jgi:hypothetical protein
MSGNKASKIVGILVSIFFILAAIGMAFLGHLAWVWYHLHILHHGQL